MLLTYFLDFLIFKKIKEDIYQYCHKRAIFLKRIPCVRDLVTDLGSASFESDLLNSVLTPTRKIVEIGWVISMKVVEIGWVISMKVVEIG